MNEEEILEDLVSRYPALDKQKSNIWNAFQMLADSYTHKGKLLTAGNGGSAADAEHIVGELMKGFVLERKIEKELSDRLYELNPEKGSWIAQKLQGVLPAAALVGNTALSSAYANDVEPLLTFAQQVYGYGKKGDVFLGISTSGNSENIWYACLVAKAVGLKVIGLTGKDGGRLKQACDVAIMVPEIEAYKVQELHVPVYHCLCLMLERCFFK